MSFSYTERGAFVLGCLGTRVPLLHVLLEARGGGDGLPGVLVDLGLGVAGVGHASGSLLRLLTVQGESTGESLRGVKERGVKERGGMG